ncbi:uncharacterized protein LOC129741706 [Uranotaenia lowii]|uniref:uncharacterized protein LOC129741706 n=1 Tax=Uranotaenia lowii TaxID=190385 RepID=UPI002479619C|nr:uncharacterized protein LOC129741706 [Uranotaenia lowii]
MGDYDVSALKEQDRQLRNSIAGITKFLADYNKDIHEAQIDVRLETLEKAVQKFFTTRRKLKVLLDEEDEEQKSDSKESETSRKRRLEAQQDQREAEFNEVSNQIEEMYFSAKSTLLALRPKKTDGHASEQDSDERSGSVMSRVKLPDIHLPNFSGRLRDWVTFRDMFRSLIHNNNQLSPVDKFTYLRSSVSDEALQEISAIDISANNYQVAWKALENRYENKKLIVKAHLDAIFSIEPVRRENCDSLNRLIGEFEKNLQMLNKIGEITDNWSTLLAHMVCCRLDPVTLRQWETHHNSKEVPTYAKLMNFLRDQCLVLQSISTTKTADPETYRPRVTTTHVSSQYRRRCVFCDAPYHSAFRCNKMRNWSVAQRISEVNKHQLCSNCLRAGHFANECPHGTCTRCDRKHHTLLHYNNFQSRSQSTQNFDVSSVPPTRNRFDAAIQYSVNSNRPNQQNQSQCSPNQEPSTVSNSYPIIQTLNPQVHPNLTADDRHSNAFISSHEASSLPVQILLSTAVVLVKDRYGNYTFARTLLDSCSEFSYITNNFAQELKLHDCPERLTVQGIGNASVVSKRSVEAIIQPRLPTISNFSQNIRFHVLPQITKALPTKPISTLHRNLLPQVTLADPEFYKPGKIDMIIGAEYFFDLLREGKQKVMNNGPTLQDSVFGWIVSGKVSENHSKGCTENQSVIQSDVSQFETSAFVSSTAQLQELISKFWDLETCHKNSRYSVEETACEEHFKQTTTRDTEGRFVVSLPKKPSIIRKLGESRDIAMRRFLGLEKRFMANPELKTMYKDFIHEYLRMGHMREVSEYPGQNLCQNVSQNLCQNLCQKGQYYSQIISYYLPHHAVLKPDSTTTKLRVVFDASCRTSTGVSLNDGLMVGPVVQNDLLSIILRFRLHRFAISADIEKMYRMVRIQKSDQCLQRILWRDSPNEEIKTYELTTVTYGTASAPYLATRCLRQLGEENKLKHPIGSKVIIDDSYVDDTLTGAETIEEGIALVREMTSITNSAGFQLRKFNSNAKEILESISSHLRDTRPILELDNSSEIVKTLGLKWDTTSDKFCFSFPDLKSSNLPITKRIVHSDAACLFDPLGLVGPIVVTAKIFIQKLWRSKLDWDDKLEESSQQFWSEYRRCLLQLSSLSIPRWLGCSKDLASSQLHGFCDASEQAYGACLYMRSVTNDGSISVRLITSKSRVAPLENLKRSKQKTSIPRLELSSALLLSHLFEKCAREYPHITEAFFWTDSMIVKHWLASHPSRWQTFVANRVSEIQHITKSGTWNHVPGIENPADLISRGASPDQLIHEKLWFEGPKWLSQEHQMWPTENEEDENNLDSSHLEEKPSTTLIIQEASSNEIFKLRESFFSLVRMVALMKRYRHNAQKVNRDVRKLGYLCQSELSDATLTLVRLSQAESFATELQDLEKCGEVKPSSRIVGLGPYLDEGAIRVQGRLRNAQMSSSRKHPWILDHHHPLAVSIARDYHIRQFHAGQQLLISSVRERFWPTNMASLARNVIRTCVPCFKTRPKVVEQVMGDLPAERVTIASAFLKVGVDYCGPFFVSYPNRRAKPVKCYVAVFVCLSTKAVHLELVMDLTTQAFLGALRRFVGRRSKPELVMCDNATTFVGASRELKELMRMFHSDQFQNSVVREASNLDIEFKFIPPRTPNFGGLWEAQVKSFKNHFRKTIGLRTLSVDEMLTALAQIEAVLNSRPITQISSDPSDFRALTPGHFLVQRPLTSLPDRDITQVPTNRLTMWQRAQQLTQQFWKKWRTQYLSDLQNRTKWTRNKTNVAVGMMVLLKEENCPPLKWPLGRITKTFLGPDGNVRVVTVKTQDGSYDRGISKICLLPILDNELGNKTSENSVRNPSESIKNQ